MADRPGTFAAGELIPAWASARAAEDLVHDALQESLVDLGCRVAPRPIRAVAPALVANRRHTRLADRELKVQRTEPRDDLRLRRAGREQPRCARRAQPAWTGVPEPPKADRSRVTRPIATTTIRTARAPKPAPRVRGGRRWAARVTPVGHRGRHPGHRSETLPQVSNARLPSVPNDQSQSGGLKRARRRGRIAAVSTRIQVPALDAGWWGLPLLLVLVWIVASAAAHVVFLFVVAALVALLLDPLVRGFAEGAAPPRPVGRVCVLDLCGCAGADHPCDHHRRRRSDEDCGDEVQRLLHECSRCGRTDRRRSRRRSPAGLAEHAPPEVGEGAGRAGPSSCAPDRAARTSASTRTKSSRSSKVQPSRSARRSSPSCCSSSSPSTCCSTCQRPGSCRGPKICTATRGEQPLLMSIEHALASYVRGQAALSLIIGASAGIGLWVLAAVGLFATRTAVRTALRGRGSPLRRSFRTSAPGSARCRQSIYALVVHPISALWVALLFPRDPPDRRSHRRPERDGQRAAAASPARDLRAPPPGRSFYGLPGALIAFAAPRRRSRDL